MYSSALYKKKGYKDDIVRSSKFLRNFIAHIYDPNTITAYHKAINDSTAEVTKSIEKLNCMPVYNLDDSYLWRFITFLMQNS